LAVLLDKFDPKSDGADRDWLKIFEESERLLYLEIDYLHEAKNTDRFAKDFKDIDWVRVPKVIREVTTPRVLVMEFVESLKLTDIAQIEKLGLDRKLLAKRVADAFVRQIVETSYFHADPHSGNMAVDTSGNLVYVYTYTCVQLDSQLCSQNLFSFSSFSFYDYGLMDSLGPNVRSGFRKFCTARKYLIYTFFDIFTHVVASS
jgi:predicted unusual protein kinase regulating ubiquinone biosynthesis (AarF/ABC1/UbiB family)